MRHLIIWMSMVVLIERSDEPNIFHAIMAPNTLQPYILYECHNTLGHNGSTRFYHFIRRHHYWKKVYQYCNKYVHSCSECRQVTLKKAQYIRWHLLLPQFPMSFISMDLVGPYRETENGNQYALTVTWMLTNYLFMIPIRSMSTEEVIKAYLTGAYSSFGGSKHIFVNILVNIYLVKELGFINVYRSPYTTTGNSIIDCMHSFLKASLRKLTL